MCETHQRAEVCGQCKGARLRRAGVSLVPAQCNFQEPAFLNRDG